MHRTCIDYQYSTYTVCIDQDQRLYILIQFHKREATVNKEPTNIMTRCQLSIRIGEIMLIHVHVV